MTENSYQNKQLSGSPLAKRAAILSFNFLLIILAYYQVKSASRSILIEYGGADLFPYVWIVSALVLGTFIGFYHRLVERHSRLKVVLGTCVAFIVLLVLFRLMLGWERVQVAFAFYILVDIFSVILVEQFWSLANTITNSAEGRRSYWFVGTGGLVGGVLGGALAALLLNYTPMTTPDLLLSCALIIGLALAMNLHMSRLGMYAEIPAGDGSPVAVAGGWRTLVRSHYLILIAAALLCAQVAQPIVEIQFIKTVAASYQDLDERTAFISVFFSVLGLVSIGVNLVLTPLIHRYLGVMAGMLTQPLMLALFSFGFIVHSTLMVASAMKIADRGLSYSINRASKELLYIPVDPVHTYQAKAWIDMLGYRLFKIFGAALILVLTQWLPIKLSIAELGWATLAVCGAWAIVIALLSREYNAYALAPAAARVLRDSTA